MAHVILQHSPQPPLSLDELRANDARAAACFDLHRVCHVRSHLGHDGRRAVCEFDAPDAESVRIGLRQLGVEFDRVWSATLHEPPDAPAAPETPPAARVVVERAFDPPIDVAEIEAIEGRGAWCLELHRVRYLQTFFSLDRRHMICLYDAPDAESVRLAQRTAGMPFERVWSAAVYVPTRVGSRADPRP
jgi:hypothetical protein